MTTINKLKNKRPSNKTERILGIVALSTIIAAGVIGFYLENAEIEPYLQAAYPEAQFFEKLDAGTYAAYADTACTELIGCD